MYISSLVRQNSLLSLQLGDVFVLLCWLLLQGSLLPVCHVSVRYSLRSSFTLLKIFIASPQKQLLRFL